MKKRNLEAERGFAHNGGPAEAKAHCCEVDILDRGTRRSFRLREHCGRSEVAEELCCSHLLMVIGLNLGMHFLLSYMICSLTHNVLL